MTVSVINGLSYGADTTFHRTYSSNYLYFFLCI